MILTNAQALLLPPATSFPRISRYPMLIVSSDQHSDNRANAASPSTPSHRAQSGTRPPRRAGSVANSGRGVAYRGSAPWRLPLAGGAGGTARLCPSAGSRSRAAAAEGRVEGNDQSERQQYGRAVRRGGGRGRYLRWVREGAASVSSGTSPPGAVPKLIQGWRTVPGAAERPPECPGSPFPWEHLGGMSGRSCEVRSAVAPGPLGWENRKKEKEKNPMLAPRMCPLPVLVCTFCSSEGNL